MSGKAYSQASVERALDLHVKGKWHRVDDSPRSKYVIATNGIGDVVFTLAQAFAFAVGCAQIVRERREGK